jgi:hypothetical protein
MDFTKNNIHATEQYDVKWNHFIAIQRLKQIGKNRFGVWH